MTDFDPAEAGAAVAATAKGSGESSIQNADATSIMPLTRQGSKSSESSVVATSRSDTSDWAARKARLLEQIKTGAWLNEQEFPALRYAVPGIVPEGMTLLSAPPKAGKSWLVLSWLLGIASGGVALGKISLGPARPVLYLALEDGDRRMQSRCRALMADEALPARFAYVTRVPVGDVSDTITAWLEDHEDAAMIVIDTLAKATPGAAPGESAYRADYRIAGALKDLADTHDGLAVVVVHHDRKAASDDFVDAASGTKGLTGAADTILVLERKREAKEAVLKVTGRDVVEAEYGLKLTGTWSWELDGDTLKDAMDAARSRRNRTSDNVSELIKYVAEGGADGRQFKQIVETIGESARTELGRQVKAGRLLNPSRGLYTVPNADTPHNDATFATFATSAGQKGVQKVATPGGDATSATSRPCGPCAACGLIAEVRHDDGLWLHPTCTVPLPVDE